MFWQVSGVFQALAAPSVFSLVVAHSSFSVAARAS